MTALPVKGQPLMPVVDRIDKDLLTFSEVIPENESFNSPNHLE